MAKGKAGGGVQNRAIYSRISFLQQAAVTLETIRRQCEDSKGDNGTNGSSTSDLPALINNTGTSGYATSLEAMSRRLATDLRAVSLKTRIRLTPAMKQSICKFCDSVLIEGDSCTSTIENKSKGAKKSWADVLVRKCHTCGRERRYPVNAPRPRRKPERKPGGDGGQLQKQTAQQQKG